VKHLVELGHSRIGFIGDTVSTQRMEVFSGFLRQTGMTVNDAYLKLGPERFEVGGYLRMKELLGARTPPTAVLAAYDDVAIGAMRAVHEAGLSVPHDISIMGIDGIEVGEYLTPSLTTIVGHTTEMAEAACGILMKKMGNPAFTVVQHVELNPELIIRQSTGAPPALPG
jgi:DNA-binding LacI/PurR family transcriptional regulator